MTVASHRDSVLAALRLSSQPLDDDQLAARTNIRPRQQVNQICRKLYQSGLIRRCLGPNQKIVNELVPPAGESPAPAGLASMRVAAWSNGSPRPSGAGYGVRLSAMDRERYFDHAWSEVLVDVDEREDAPVPLSKSFWDRCSELRSAAIGRWLIRNGLGSWPRGRPPTVQLQHVADNRFKLLIEHPPAADRSSS